ncbi:Radical S-adenosyl methionine domain-containing protein 2 [Goodea atripinnis]|uniref:Radical S-adenosyl methionine domain-containing protein 2 n=1 Tax=Goodea atripinnis TaxID=208336 RepID=A0ABV0MX22_9TELE
MLLSSLIVSPRFILELCISTINCIFSSVFSKVCSWSRGACRATKSLVSDANSQSEQRTDENVTTPTSVNYHFTRKCNYKCGFCFHTAKTSFVLPLEEAKRGLKLLKEAGDFLDILAVSCDSFDEETNQLIGRSQGRKSHIENLYKIRSWCQQYKVAFKINSVINSFNVHEDLTEQINQLNPVRWKVFQCLLIDGENAGETALREAEKFVISDLQFQEFLDRHSAVSCLVPESNEKV